MKLGRTASPLPADEENTDVRADVINIDQLTSDHEVILLVRIASAADGDNTAGVITIPPN